jgi:hypothetical protein
MSLMPKYFGVARTPDGRVYAGAVVYVYNSASFVLASIYADDNTTALSNPLTVDQFGVFQFSANAGAYDIYVRTDRSTVQPYLQVTMGSPGGSGAVDSVNSRTGDVVLVGADLPVFGVAGTGHAPGAVPDPGSTPALQQIMTDAGWQLPEALIFIGGAGHIAGLAPDPGAGAIGKRALFDNGTWLNPYAFAATYGYTLILDQKTQGTNAGTATAGSWITRTLNVLAADTTAAVILASNIITLPAGSYIFHISVPGFSVQGHQCRLLDITAGTVIATGTSEYAGANNQSRSVLVCRVTVDIGLTNEYEIQQYVNSTQATNGFGAAANIDTETYTSVLIMTEPSLTE